MTGHNAAAAGHAMLTRPTDSVTDQGVAELDRSPLKPTGCR